MAYNSNKGNQHMGDVQYEGDPTDVQIDFENDFVAIKTNAQQRLIVSGSSITASVTLSCSSGISASTFTGDGNGLTNLPPAAVNVYNSYSPHRVITAGPAAGEIDAEANLTFDGTTLSVTGDISGSTAVSASTAWIKDGTVVQYGTNFATVIDGTHISSSLNISGAAIYVDVPGLMEIHKSNSGHAQIRTETAHLQLRNKANNKDIRFQLGEDAGSTAVKVRNNSSAEVASIDSQGNAVFRHMSASLGVTGSSFHGDTAGLLYPIKTVQTAYSATLLDYTILGNTASGNVTVTLPSASLGERKIYNIKKVDSSNTLTITADSGSIDGVANKNLTTLYESLSLHSNGSDWFII